MASSALAREELFALRREIARIEGKLAEKLDLPAARRGAEGPAGEQVDATVLRRGGVVAPAMMPLGVPALDLPLGGGVPLAALTEIHGAQMRDAGAVAGFALGLAALMLRDAPPARPILWIAAAGIFAEAGEPYMPGILPRFGLSPERMLLCRARRMEDALWVAEEAGAAPALALVVLETGGSPKKLDLTATRRLHRRAGLAGRPLLLLRQSGQAEPTAAPVRLRVASAPAGERPLLAGFLEGSIGPPAMTVSITRSRTNMPASATLEWSDHARAFRTREPAVRAADRWPPHPRIVAAPSQDRSHPAAAPGARLAPGGRGHRAA